MARLTGKSFFIFILSATNAVLAMAAIYFCAEVFSLSVTGTLFSTALVVLAGTFVVATVDSRQVSARIAQLTSRIGQRFGGRHATGGGPALERLELQVQELIQAREKEQAHFQNVDSYRKEFLGNVSHELKTPVFTIQGYVNTLLNGAISDPAVNIEYLQRADKAIDRLISIIDDLETITQLESGELVLEQDAFDIAALCADVFASMELPAAQKKIGLRMENRFDQPVMVLGDKFRIRQVLVNLISNSIKYGREGGTTRVSFSQNSGEIEVSVSDDGAGIEEKHLPRIFERFYRVDKGRSREQGGTGLGLSIVKHIMDAHGKPVRVESRPGKGSVFSIRLASEP